MTQTNIEKAYELGAISYEEAVAMRLKKSITTKENFKQLVNELQKEKFITPLEDFKLWDLFLDYGLECFREGMKEAKEIYSK